jgi:hypothetical protein
VADIINRADNSKTTFMGYFEMNRTDQNACRLLYVEFPEHYTWKRNKWKVHERGFSIAHLHFSSPSSGEGFYLPTLLMVVRGSRSFEELRAFNGIQYAT